jgi:hypothetical protein
LLLKSPPTPPRFGSDSLVHLLERFRLPSTPEATCNILNPRRRENAPRAEQHTIGMFFHDELGPGFPAARLAYSLWDDHLTFARQASGLHPISPYAGKIY